jgi:trk system potassium uptake protein TrkH
MVVATFMMLFGVNFNLFYFILLGQGLAIFKSEELRIYLITIASSVLAIALNIMRSVGGFGQGLRYAYFQVATVMSTTGFATADFDKWPEFSRWLLVLLMFGGACAGSTAGGLKLSRVIILFKSYLYELKQLILPTRVKRIWFEGKAVSDQTVRSVLVYFFTYLAIIGIGTLLIALDEHDLVTNLTASVACMSNIGPGLNLVGPTGNFAFFSVFSKLVLILEMLLGRLEIFPVLFLFAPSVWKKR